MSKKASNERGINISLDNGDTVLQVSELSDKQVARALLAVAEIDAQHMAKIACDGEESPRRYLELFCLAWEREEGFPFQVARRPKYQPR